MDEPALLYYLEHLIQITLHPSRMRLGEIKHKITVPEGIRKSMV